MGKITVNQHKVGSGKRWVVSRFNGGKRCRSFFKSKTSADAEAARLRSEIQQTGEAWNSIPANERSRLIAVWRDAKAKGIDLETLVRESNGKSTASKSLADTITELLSVKEKAGKAEPYRDGLSSVLNQFARGRETMPIASITLADVETFLDSKKIASRSTLRARLSTLFKFAVRREYCISNPCSRLEPVTHTKPPPIAMTPMQAARCLVWLRKNPRAMGWFVLTTFYGLRPEEAQNTHKQQINFKSGVVIVDGQTSKVRQRRVVECPHPTALRLLKLAKKLKTELPITRQVRRRNQARLRKVLRWKAWPKDITRHTAASYWLGLTHNADYVAEQLGHSVRVLKRDYKALVTKEMVKRFWGGK